MNKLKPCILECNSWNLQELYISKELDWWYHSFDMYALSSYLLCGQCNAEGDPNINSIVILLVELWNTISGFWNYKQIASLSPCLIYVVLRTLASASLYIRTTSLDMEGKQTNLLLHSLSFWSSPHITPSFWWIKFNYTWDVMISYRTI